jgi:hypothetical protein
MNEYYNHLFFLFPVFSPLLKNFIIKKGQWIKIH